MKTFNAIAASTFIVAATIDLSTAMETYLTKLPNGSKFKMAIGHPGGDSSKKTKLADLFKQEGYKWTEKLCKTEFEGASMTYGAAFGDPCCSFKEGGTPDFEVEAFTDKPTKATVCATDGAAGKGDSAETPSGDGGDATQMPPSTGDTPETTGSPSPSTPPSPAGGCAAKPSRKLRK
ncbi:uncharacterized protein PHALS_01942 [Plasmopara halstedii]|uniref:Temptin Cys/Cys disulfide domain-containing protein n=1 Tax=Plasmopara halstedii TaxID=4781 RepID=A0A0N7L6Z6_PLAHL|nr:uncharacterized protein PHALS_01942 [Plasmopara halstedii]CEG45659.1 hypothetical protein PHALS_01942 [Plasmopara halstedii]|eukprot:XP_024582028.1 hypothetical protein PHALS_01942 [Plasmopara halstedii]